MKTGIFETQRNIQLDVAQQIYKRLSLMLLLGTLCSTLIYFTHLKALKQMLSRDLDSNSSNDTALFGLAVLRIPSYTYSSVVFIEFYAIVP